jgi:hypothetical protein
MSGAACLLHIFTNVSITMSVSSFHSLFENRSTWVQNDINTALTEVKEHCQPWLRESRGDFAWRGLNYPSEEPCVVKTVRKNRKPMNTGRTAHKVLDNLFLEEHGWLARSSGLFCTGSYSVAKDYGTHTCLMFPMGEFRYLWNPSVPDLYYAIDDNMDEFDTQDAERLVAGYTDKNLHIALQKNVEIMVDCDYYLVIREDLSNDIVKRGLGGTY